jgi:hypothetical protein
MITQTLPAYLYQQYTQDPYSDELQAFFTAYNNTSQTYLNNTNNLNLPVYVGQYAPLLDWTVYAIYGVERPSIGTPTKFSPLGVYDTLPYNTSAYSQDFEIAPTNIYVVTDDIFKRILTWNFYKGDGFQFTNAWLKRRVVQFLYGTNGAPVPIDNTFNISVTYSGNTITITVPNLVISPIFQSCLQSGVLQLPFQYTYVVDISSGTIPWLNNSSTAIGWKNNSSMPITWYTDI